MQMTATVLALLLHANVFSCTCAGYQPLLLSQYPGGIVFQGVVQRYITARGIRNPVAMDVEICRVLRGRYEAKTIRIVGDFGASCVPYVSRFPIATEWVFSVHGPMNVPDLGDENFGFELCSVSGLPVKDGRVKGPISSFSVREMTIDELQWTIDDLDLLTLSNRR